MPTATVSIVHNPKTNVVGLIPSAQQQEELLNMYNQGITKTVIEFCNDIDADINDKYFQLIGIFADPKFSMPENLEDYFFYPTKVKNKKARMDIIRKRILIDIGQYQQEYAVFEGQTIIARIARSTKTFGEEYQTIYSETRDWIFGELRSAGWTSKDLQEAFECLFIGIPKKEYNILYPKIK